jgi:hypothetical protein
MDRPVEARAQRESQTELTCSLWGRQTSPPFLLGRRFGRCFCSRNHFALRDRHRSTIAQMRSTRSSRNGASAVSGMRHECHKWLA